ncbi:Wadjet anti-phage system protein JetD domain-containing protein [Microlunatus parietis]|uniref:Wadjet protein JetD C-terminal domain-containing protein n=1 Tax=Microlunatus parietis TaxID=682979 RepID=A0A7Y9LBM0_9ACTN|nr:Wadjet anti-phage system protein JetD domain-containing protein [Microlunatus parietis]NYE73964.1 hypothetical protein [Microlunatus parietis]
MSARWTTPADVAAKVRRRWDDGSLLTALARDEPFPGFDVPLRGPKAAELGSELAAAQDWVAQLERGAYDGRRYHLEYGTIGGQHIGRSRIPTRARLTEYDQAWALLGVGRSVAAYRRILELTAAEPAVRAWVEAQPLRALDAAEDWPRLLAAYRWLSDHRGSRRYLRQITARGVDTKFVERHRPLLARLLGTSQTAPGFLADLGLRARPDLVRLRFDPAALGLPKQLSEATVRVAELAELPADVRTAMIIENEITFLSVPVPAGGVVIWGKGFEVDRAGRMPWLAESKINYWGDLDTHGFAILNQLRAWLPQTRSFLMDRETLLAHRDRWVTEDSPTNARLDRLTAVEAQLYTDLVEDRLGPSVRLEQERLDWAWVQQRLPIS